jgi:hypothetical protein
VAVHRTEEVDEEGVAALKEELERPRFVQRGPHQNESHVLDWGGPAKVSEEMQK